MPRACTASEWSGDRRGSWPTRHHAALIISFFLLRQMGKKKKVTFSEHTSASMRVVRQLLRGCRTLPRQRQRELPSRSVCGSPTDFSLTESLVSKPASGLTS